MTIRIKGLPLKVILAILQFIRKITTGKDNETPDVIRVGGILIGFQFIVLAGVNWDKFDPTGYGTGAGLVLAAIGAALRLKQPSEE